MLADMFENSWNICMRHYVPDPVHYYTAPGLSYDTALKISGVKFDLLIDPDIQLMMEKGIHGGFIMASQRYARVNNPYVKGYGKSHPANYLLYLDANNLFGCAMNRHLATRDHVDRPLGSPNLSTLAPVDALPQ